MAYALNPLRFRVFLRSYCAKFSDSEINNALGLTVVRSDMRSGIETARSSLSASLIHVGNEIDISRRAIYLFFMIKNIFNRLTKPNPSDYIFKNIHGSLNKAEASINTYFTCSGNHAFVILGKDDDLEMLKTVVSIRSITASVIRSAHILAKRVSNIHSNTTETEYMHFADRITALAVGSEDSERDHHIQDHLEVMLKCSHRMQSGLSRVAEMYIFNNLKAGKEPDYKLFLAGMEILIDKIIAPHFIDRCENADKIAKGFVAMESKRQLLVMDDYFKDLVEIMIAKGTAF